MHFLEAEVAKVQLGTPKSSSTAVNLLAEAGAVPDLEYFGISELPIFNPAALEDCQRLSESLFATLRRQFKTSHTKHGFEVTMAEVNQVMVAALGQPNLAGFVEKINACLAVRQGDIFSVAACGDIAVLLYRDGSWQEIVPSGVRGDREKMFTAIMSGKLLAGDFVVLGTNALLQSISLDRLGAIVRERSVPDAGSELVKVLDEIGESGLAFGALLVRFSDRESVAVATPVVQQPGGVPDDNSPQSEAKKYAFKLKASLNKFFEPQLDKARQVVKKISPSAESAGKVAVMFSKKTALTASSRAIDLSKFARTGILRISRRSWMFVCSGILLVILLITITQWRNNRETAERAILSQQSEILTNVENVINQAESKQIYGDDAGARDAITDAQNLLNQISLTELNARKSELTSAMAKITRKIDKVEEAKFERVATLLDANRLTLGTGVISTIFDKSQVKFDLSTGQATEGSSPFASLLVSLWLPGDKLVVYNGDSLRLWKGVIGSQGALGEEFFQQIPKSADFGGMSFYPVNNRIYIADNGTRSIVSFEVKSDKISSPKAWATSGIPAGVKDIAVDGSVYLVGEFGLKKFYQGKEIAFFSPPKGLDLSGAVRVIATTDSNVIYILDPKHKRIVILDKQGTLKSVLNDESLQSSSDIFVKENGQEIYFLSDGSLFKIKREVQ